MDKKIECVGVAEVKGFIVVATKNGVYWVIKPGGGEPYLSPIKFKKEAENEPAK